MSHSIWHLLLLALTCDGARVSDGDVADQAGARDSLESQDGFACQKVVAEQGEPDDVNDMMVRHDLTVEKEMLDAYLAKSQGLLGGWKSRSINKELFEGGHEERFSKKGVNIYLVRRVTGSWSSSEKSICFVESDVKGSGWQPPNVYSDSSKLEYGKAGIIPHRVEVVKLPKKWIQGALVNLVTLTFYPDQNSLDLSSSLKSLPINVQRMLRERGAEDVHDRLMASIKKRKEDPTSKTAWLRGEVRKLKPSFNSLGLDVLVCKGSYRICVPVSLSRLEVSASKVSDEDLEVSESKTSEEEASASGPCDYQTVKERWVTYVDLTKMKRGYHHHECF